MWASAARVVVVLVLVVAGTRANAESSVYERCLQLGKDEADCLALSNVRRRRQALPDSFTNDYVLCLLSASASGDDPSTCDHLSSICTCVPYWQCLDDTQKPGPEANLQPIVNLRVQGVACNVTEHVCCTNFDFTLPAPTPAPTGQEYQSRCGQRKPDGFGATFQGFIDRQAQLGEFPWMAAVMTSQVHQGTSANFYICGASLIHRQVVLTAAHHVTDKSADQLMVRLGEWNFKEQTEPIQHQDFLVSRVMVHPKYNPASFQYDVALLFLDGTAELGPTVDVICLPEVNQDFSGPGCYSSGWGKDVFGQEGAYQQILKSIELPAVPNPACERALRTTRLGSFFKLHSSFMCAGGEAGIDTCTGDGGSPLVCPDPSNPSRYIQAGIVAWGIGCGQDGIPGVYAAVSHAVSWIQQELQSNFGFDVRTQV